MIDGNNFEVSPEKKESTNNYASWEQHFTTRVPITNLHGIIFLIKISRLVLGGPVVNGVVFLLPNSKKNTHIAFRSKKA